jgi:ankyrin repeat protein
VNAKNENGCTILMIASYYGQKEVVKLLLENGVDVNARQYAEDYANGRTALMLAARNGHKEVVELLIEKGADVNAGDEYGKTALELAYEKGHKEIAELIKSYEKKK